MTVKCLTWALNPDLTPEPRSLEDRLALENEAADFCRKAGIGRDSASIPLFHKKRCIWKPGVLVLTASCQPVEAEKKKKKHMQTYHAKDFESRWVLMWSGTSKMIHMCY